MEGGCERCSVCVWAGRGGVEGGANKGRWLGEEAEKTVKGQRQGETLALCTAPTKLPTHPNPFAYRKLCSSLPLLFVI